MLLRDYQLKTLENVEKSFEKNKAVILVAPCGSGKTVMAVEFIRRAVDRAEDVLFLAHRIELVKQTNSKLENFDLDYGVIMAGWGSTLFPGVQVASIQTLTRRLNKKYFRPPPADLIVVDECHHAAANSYHQIFDYYPDAKILGLTATPIRTDGVGLGGAKMFDDIVCAPSVQELIDLGHLVPIKYYAPTVPDLEKVKITAGEYNLKQLESKMDHAELVGDIVSNFSRICPDRRAVVFSSGVRHSKHIKDQFLGAGIMAEHLDARTPKDERHEILERLKTGQTQVVSNCMVLTEGWDCPPVSCIILARPTKSLGLYLQMAGRGLRPCPEIGKLDTILIDHSGAVYKHGRVEDEKEWSLNPYKKIKGKKPKSKGGAEIICAECKFIYVGFPACPECGHIPVISAKDFKVREGDLSELNGSGKLLDIPDTKYQRERFFQELRFFGDTYGFKKGYAAVNFKARYGEWPPKYKDRPIPPSPETKRWINKKSYEYRKGRELASRPKVAL